MLCLSQSECLKRPIQTQLSQNQNKFSEFFSAFPDSTSNLEYFEKKDEPQRLFVSDIIDCKKQGYINDCLLTY